jgi:Domain of unknown function (DUF5004)
MKNMLLLFRLLVVLLFYLTACEDKESTPQPASRADMLTAKTWKMNKVLADGINITNDPAAAEFKSMRIKFQADKNYTITTSSGTVTGTWTFADNETKVVFDPNTAGENTWELEELKDNSAKARTSIFSPAVGKMVQFSFEFVNN